MSEGPAWSLDARLAEIDRRLSSIQQGLTPDRPAAPVSLPPDRPAAPGGLTPDPAAPPAGPPPDRPAAPGPGGRPPAAPPVDGLAGPGPPEELRHLTQAHERALRELLAAYDRALAQAGSSVDVNVGPLRSTSAVREFERALSEIPGVREVTVRGFEGADRVVFEVRVAAGRS